MITLNTKFCSKMHSSENKPLAPVFVVNEVWTKVINYQILRSPEQNEPIHDKRFLLDFPSYAVIWHESSVILAYIGILLFEQTFILFILPQILLVYGRLHYCNSIQVLIDDHISHTSWLMTVNRKSSLLALQRTGYHGLGIQDFSTFNTISPWY